MAFKEPRAASTERAIQANPCQGTCVCTLDLSHWRSGADVATGFVGAGAWQVEFEIEETTVGFAVGRDRNLYRILGGQAQINSPCLP